jgi:hypothetical protein
VQVELVRTLNTTFTQGRAISGYFSAPSPEKRRLNVMFIMFPDLLQLGQFFKLFSNVIVIIFYSQIIFACLGGSVSWNL